MLDWVLNFFKCLVKRVSVGNFVLIIFFSEIYRHSRVVGKTNKAIPKEEIFNHQKNLIRNFLKKW